MADNSDKIVTISYVGRLDSGWEFVSAPPEAPIRFPCAPGWMPPEIVDAVRTMEVGETRIAHVAAADAYEERSDANIIRVPRANLAPNTELKVGDVAHLQDSTGKEFPARLVSIDDEEAVFDANHATVGQGMHFEITLLAVQETPAARMRHETN